MDEKDIQKELDDLAHLFADMSTLRAYEAEEIDKIIPADIKKKVADLRLELSPKISTVMQKISATEALIVSETLKHGASVKGSKLKAIFQKGKTAWDSDRLKDFAKTHYQILAFKKTGKPNVRIAPK